MIENCLLKEEKNIKHQLLVFSNIKVEINSINGTKLSYSTTQQVIMQLLTNLQKIEEKDEISSGLQTIIEKKRLCMQRTQRHIIVVRVNGLPKISIL